MSEEGKKNAFVFEEKGLSRAHKTIAIHPGMAGSALNWPESHYVALARRLIRRYNVIITGGPGEIALVERVFNGIARQQTYAPDQPIFTRYVGEKGLGDMIAILSQCDGLVAPSTGPLHLAVALGKKVVSRFFRPLKFKVRSAGARLAWPLAPT